MADEKKDAWLRGFARDVENTSMKKYENIKNLIDSFKTDGLENEKLSEVLTRMLELIDFQKLHAFVFSHWEVTDEDRENACLLLSKLMRSKSEQNNKDG